MNVASNTPESPEEFSLRGISPADYQALEAERDALQRKLEGYEHAVSAIIDEDTIRQSYTAVRHLYTGIKDSLALRDAGTLLNRMLEQVARSGLKLAQRDELLRECLMAVRHGEDFDLPVTTMSRIDAALATSEPPATPHDHNAQAVLFGLPEALESLSGSENTAGVLACIEYIKDEIRLLGKEAQPTAGPIEGSSLSSSR